VGIEAAIEAYHQRHAAFGHDREARFGPTPVEVERLLTEDGLAGAGRRLDEVGMGVGRAGDDNGVNCRVGKDRGLRRDRGTVAARQPLGGVAFDVDNRREAGPGWRAIFSAWMAPIRPAPNWQKLIMIGSSAIVSSCAMTWTNRPCQ
jgi:hypothetical protein